MWSISGSQEIFSALLHSHKSFIYVSYNHETLNTKISYKSKNDWNERAAQQPLAINIFFFFIQ